MRALWRFITAIPVLLLVIGVIFILSLASSFFINKETPSVQQASSETLITTKTVNNLSFEKGEIWNIWRQNTPNNSSKNYASRTIDLTTDKDYLDYTFLCNSPQSELSTVGEIDGFIVNQCTNIPKTNECTADKAGTRVVPCVYDTEGNVRRVSFTLQGKPWIYPIALLYDNVVPATYKPTVQASHWVLVEMLKPSQLDMEIAKRQIDQTDFYSFNCSDRPEYASCTTDGADSANLYYKPVWATHFYVIQLIPNYFYRSAG